MTKTQKQQTVVSVLIFLVILIIDQVIKISVKTGMTLHQSIRVTDWFYISYIENNGMAWGMSIMPKIMLSLFRLVAIFGIGWYIYKQIQKGSRWLYIVLLSMVLAGAAGNLIDCMFYGMIFSGASSDYTSFFVPWGTGYAPFLEGRVVDMFYFPLIVTNYPDWFPVWGGERFVFFSPVFNFADASISVSVVSILLFCRTELQLLFK
ncbi:MAG: lipoprotein signal peptidase [Prevotella sp.]|nr:lipoprotein signal peptidase [Prevotella sp.]